MNFSKFVLAATMATVACQAPALRKGSRNLKEEEDSAVSMRGLQMEECYITFVNAELKKDHVPTDPDSWFSKTNHIDPKPYATFEFVSKGPDGFVHEAEDVTKGRTKDDAGLNPQWMETLPISYKESSKGYNLNLELWDDDSGNFDDYIGKGSVVINNKKHRNRENITVELKNEKEQGHGVIVGTMTIFLDECSFLESSTEEKEEAKKEEAKKEEAEKEEAAQVDCGWQVAENCAGCLYDFWESNMGKKFCMGDCEWKKHQCMPK